MEIKLTRWFIYEWGKPTWLKPHRVILRSPLLRIHYYQKKRLQVKESQSLIPTYSWTLTPIPNWTCFVMTISPFQCTAPSTWLTNCADLSTRLQSPTRRLLAAKFFNSSRRWRSWSCLVTKPYSVQTQQLLQELGQTRIPITLFFTLVEFSLVQLVSPSMALKIILIYVYGCEKRKPKYTFMDWMKSPEKLNFINLDKLPSIELTVEPWVSAAFKSQ